MPNSMTENLHIGSEWRTYRLRYKIINKYTKKIPKKLPPHKDRQVFLQKPRNQVPRCTAINFQQIYEAAFGKFLPVRVKILNPTLMNKDKLKNKDKNSN